MFITILGVQISILGLIAIGLGIFSMILLIYHQKMTWYIWTLWLGISIIWFAHFMIFQDVASLIDTCISISLNLFGLVLIFQKGKRKHKKRKRR